MVKALRCFVNSCYGTFLSPPAASAHSSNSLPLFRSRSLVWRRSRQSFQVPGRASLEQPGRCGRRGRSPCVGANLSLHAVTIRQGLRLGRRSAEARAATAFYKGICNIFFPSVPWILFFGCLSFPAGLVVHLLCPCQAVLGKGGGLHTPSLPYDAVPPTPSRHDARVDPTRSLHLWVINTRVINNHANGIF